MEFEIDFSVLKENFQRVKHSIFEKYPIAENILCEAFEQAFMEEEARRLIEG